MANQEMFQRVNAMLTAFPELHSQTWWEEPDTIANGSCGTTRCVAGWAVWLKAQDLGLISRKRDTLGSAVLRRVAERVGVETEDSFGLLDEGTLYHRVGAVLLGLTEDQAHSLFMDMTHDRVTHRVASYATTGEDISDAEYNVLSGV